MSSTSSTSESVASAPDGSTSSVQSMTVFSTRPMPSISQRTRSPGARKTGRIAIDADAAGRAGRDDVARIERDRATDELDQLGHAPDHVGGRAVLHQDLATGVRARAGDPPRPQPERLRVRDLVRADEDRAHRQERVRALGAQPLAVACLALAEGRRNALPVAGTDVVDDDVARDVVERAGRRDAPRRRPDDDPELDLEVERVGPLRPDDRVAVGDDGIGELREQERARGERPATLAGVLAVVEPDADDLARDGDRRDRLDVVEGDPRRAAEGLGPLAEIVERGRLEVRARSGSRP